MGASDSDNEREVKLRVSAVAAREAAADAREVALEVRETTVEIRASGVSQREVQADRREQHADERAVQADRREVNADRREVKADRREQHADEREDELARLHPPTAEVAEQFGRETLDRALAQLRRAEDAVARARSHLARTGHLAKQDAAGEQEAPRACP